MTTQQPYIQAAVNSLPSAYQAPFQRLLSLSQQETSTLDTVLNFITDGQCPPDASSQTRLEWAEKQLAVQQAFRDIRGLTDNKRAREEGANSASTQTSKRLKLDPELQVAYKDDPPRYTLHSISTTSPVRKKVNVTIHASSLQFTHPTSNEIEAVVPLSGINRAFILPTRGKQKPHWTVVFMSGDIPDRGKATSSSQANQQIIFGLDAVTTSPFTVTTYPSPSTPKPEIISKGKDTLPCLRSFCSRLPTPTLEPSTDIFRSAVPNPGGRNGGVSGVEAYLAAKPGTLWFLKEGILWGEGKPCEFWAVGDLSSSDEGVRLVSATGRTCTVILSRMISYPEEEDEIEETEFAMVDGKEQDGIKGWVRRFRSRFGQKVSDVSVPETNGAGETSVLPSPAKSTDSRPIPVVRDEDADDDESDESFETDSEDDGGSASSDSESSGSDGGASNGEDEAEGTDDGGEEELRPANHPLMRPGAMPKMSRAAINAVVEMVEEDMMGGSEDELND